MNATNNTGISAVEIEVNLAKINGGYAIRFGGHHYQCHFVHSDKADYETVDRLAKEHYMVHGFRLVGNVLCWGYTIVFNADKKGIYTKFPHHL